MSLFGNSNTGGGGGLFGNTTANSGGGLFGAKPAATTTGGGLFGNTTANSGGGLFGAKPAATTTGGGLFGNTAAAAPSGGGLFGGASATTAPSGGLFGAKPAATIGGGLFGSAPAATTGGGLFGAKPAGTAGGLFGATAPAAGGGLFGNNTAQAAQTAQAPGVILPPDLMEKLQRDLPVLAEYPNAPEFMNALEHIHAEKCSIKSVEQKAKILLEREETFKRALEVTVSTLLARIRSRHKALQKQFLTVIGLMEDAARMQGIVELDNTQISLIYEKLCEFEHLVGHCREGKMRHLEHSIEELNKKSKVVKEVCDIDQKVIDDLQKDREEKLRLLGSSIAELGTPREGRGMSRDNRGPY